MGVTIEDSGPAGPFFPQFGFIPKSEFRASVSSDHHDFAVKDIFTKDRLEQKNTFPHMFRIFERVKNTKDQIIFQEFESLDKRATGDIIIDSIHFYD
jgi:hypothetical protein